MTPPKKKARVRPSYKGGMRFPFILDEETHISRSVNLRYFRQTLKDEKISYADILRSLSCITRDIIKGKITEKEMGDKFLTLLSERIKQERAKAAD